MENTLRIFLFILHIIPLLSMNANFRPAWYYQCPGNTEGWCMTPNISIGVGSTVTVQYQVPCSPCNAFPPCLPSIVPTFTFCTPVGMNCTFELENGCCTTITCAILDPHGFYGECPSTYYQQLRQQQNLTQNFSTQDK